MIMKRAFARGIALGAAAAFTFIVVNGCKGSQNEEMGPVEVVEAFNRAITAGEFEKAEELCDSISMKDYLESYAEAWYILQEEDSTILSIASSILGDAVIEVEEVTKDGDRRSIRYTLEADGHSKSRKAIVKKVEGAWRVEKITDAN